MMTAPRSAVAFAVVSLLLTGSTLIPEAERRTSAPIAGTWNAVAGERLGKDYTAGLQKLQMQWVIDGNEIRVTSRGMNRAGYTYKLDRSKQPAQLDLHMTATNRDLPAICKLEGGRLFICIPSSVTEKQRPTEFKSTIQPRTILYIFERAPASKP